MDDNNPQVTDSASGEIVHGAADGDKLFKRSPSSGVKLKGTTHTSPEGLSAKEHGAASKPSVEQTSVLKGVKAIMDKGRFHLGHQ